MDNEFNVLSSLPSDLNASSFLLIFIASIEDELDETEILSSRLLPSRYSSRTCIVAKPELSSMNWTTLLLQNALRSALSATNSLFSEYSNQKPCLVIVIHNPQLTETMSIIVLKSDTSLISSIVPTGSLGLDMLINGSTDLSSTGSSCSFWIRLR